MKLKTTKILYWIFTILLALPMAGSGFGFLTLNPAVAAGMTHLGYPLYFARFVGAAKVLAVIAILVGKFRLVKEWAYAGLAFTMIGASYSHLGAGDGAKEALQPVVILVFLAVSYTSWKKIWPNNGDQQGAAHAVVRL